VKDGPTAISIGGQCRRLSQRQFGEGEIHLARPWRHARDAGHHVRGSRARAVGRRAPRASPARARSRPTLSVERAARRESHSLGASVPLRYWWQVAVLCAGVPRRLHEDRETEARATTPNDVRVVELKNGFVPVGSSSAAPAGPKPAVIRSGRERTILVRAWSWSTYRSTGSVKDSPAARACPENTWGVVSPPPRPRRSARAIRHHRPQRRRRSTVRLPRHRDGRRSGAVRDREGPRRAAS